MSVNNVIPENQLPAWMRQAKRGVDWGALLVIGFCVFAGWSMITQSSLAITNDSEAYVYRSADYADAFAQGIFYSRWSPHAVAGYGAPIPHYYPSGASYVAGLISFLFTNNAVTAVRVLYVLSLILAGSMTYTFVTQRTSALAGIIAALLYVFSPYIMLTVSYIEGDLPLAVGTALLPSLVWATNRLLKRHQAIDFMLIAVIVAAIIFTVPIILLQSILVMLVLLGIEFHKHVNWGKLITLGAALLTGVLLSAFYWLPAAMQFNQVNWYESLYPNAPSQLNLADLFAYSQILDAGIAIHAPIYNLGWGILFALIITLPMLILGKTDKHLSISFFALGFGILSLVLVFTPERSSWLVLSLFCFSIAASYVGQNYQTNFVKRFFGLAIILVTILSTVSIWVIPEPRLPIEDISAASQVNYERSGYGYVGIPNGLALPSNLAPQDALERPISPNSDYENNISRLQNLGLVSSMIDESPFVGRYTISSNRATRLTYSRAYFDGWQAFSNIDDLTVSETNNNLISLNIPADADTNVTLRIGLTGLTLFAWFISILALMICLAYWWYRFQNIESDYDESVLLSRRSSTLILFLLIGITIVRVIVPVIMPNLFTEQPLYSLESALFIRTSYDRSFQLLAYDLSEPNYQVGDDIQLTAYWTLERPTNSQYLVRLSITDDLRRNTYYSSAYTHAGYSLSNRWQVSSIVPQEFIADLPDNLPAGNYFITFDVIVCNSDCTFNGLDFADSDGQIRVLRPITIE